MIDERVVINEAGRRPGAWAVPLWATLLLLLIGCGDGEDSGSAASQQAAPGVSLVVPVLESAPADMHALVPADSVAYIQAVSFEALKDASNAYVRLIDPTLVTDDPREWLAGLGLFDPSRVDFERPCALAVSAVAGDFPLTLIFASSDAGALSRTAAPGIAIATQGDYASFSPSGEPVERGSPLTANLPTGTISGRFDLPPLVEAGRPAFELGLGLLQMQVASQPSPMGLDMNASMGAVAEMARGLMDAVESLEFAVGQDGRELELNAVLGVKDGSPLGGFPPPVGGDLRDLASRVDPAAPIVLLARADIDTMTERSQDIIRLMLEAYFPADSREMDLDEMMGGWSALYRLAVGTNAGTVSFENGLMGWSVFECTNPAALINGYTELVEDGLMNMAFSHVRAEPTLTVAGVPVVTFRQTVDFDQLYGETTDPRVREQMIESMRQVYGGEDGMLVHLLHAGNRVGLMMGVSDASVDEALVAALSEPAGDLEPGIAALVDELDSHDAGFAVRLDLMAYTRGLLRMVDPDRSTTAFDGSAPMTMVAAVRGNDWDLSLILDLGGCFEAFSRLELSGR
jgi:hypothetical protein